MSRDMRVSDLMKAHTTVTVVQRTKKPKATGADPTHLRGHGGLSAGNVVPGVAKRLPPRFDERVLALVIVQKCRPRPVGLEHVELD